MPHLNGVIVAVILYCDLIISVYFGSMTILHQQKTHQHDISATLKTSIFMFEFNPYHAEFLKWNYPSYIFSTFSVGRIRVNKDF